MDQNVCKLFLCRPYQLMKSIQVLLIDTVHVEIKPYYILKENLKYKKILKTPIHETAKVKPSYSSF